MASMKETKSLQMKLRVTPSEKASIEANAEKLGMSMAAYMVRQATEKPTK